MKVAGDKENDGLLLIPAKSMGQSSLAFATFEQTHLDDLGPC
jgi:hypothetical protein